MSYAVEYNVDGTPHVTSGLSRIQAIGKAVRESKKDGGRIVHVWKAAPYGQIVYYNGYVDHTDGAPI